MSVTGVLKMRSGIYRCPDDIKNFKISVKLGRLYSSALHSGSDIDLNITEKETKTFSWQEKVFSCTEAEFYAKESNCLTDLDKHYHEILKTKNELPGRLFSYIQGDAFYANHENVTTEIDPNITKLHKAMSNLRVRKKIKDNSKNISVGYEINKFLNNSITNPFTLNCYETMYVMADLGASNSNIWLKSEHILCTIKYDPEHKILWMYPDFSRNIDDPYTLEIDVDGKIVFEFSIENLSNVKNSDILSEEKFILEKINTRNREKKSEIFIKDFQIPPRNILRSFVFFEILTAKNFEYDNIYVQYHIELPDNWSCVDQQFLTGTTQTCKTSGHENVAHFGHNFEICLEYVMSENNNEYTSCCPQIYFHIISRDNWERYRTEGLSYKFIPIFEPGIHTFTLQCIRVRPKYPTGELRRYFIGDYFNIDDISWVGLPKDHEGSTINKYGVPTIGTGTIDIRLNIINQSKMFKNSSFDEYQSTKEHLNASNSTNSVSDVISAYRRAREKMLHARRNLINNDE